MKNTICLIDKDPAVIDMISFLLADEGYDVVIAKLPFDISEVVAEVPHLILLHNGMDNKGLEICKQLKACIYTASIPILMSSTDVRLPQLAEECGADRYILKPFDIKDFCAIVYSMLKH